MPLNPALRQETLSSPIERGNPLNDPQYAQQQGYNNYDLNNTQLISPRFGEVTPSTVFDTVPGDRHMLHGNGLTILNQIDANLVTQVNQYDDYFYVPYRCIFPNNWDKIIVNPTRGDDLPWDALPQIPLMHFLRDILMHPRNIGVRYLDSVDLEYVNLRDIDYASISSLERYEYDVLFDALIYVSTILSRGQLLDYLGFCLDVPYNSPLSSSRIENMLQKAIDDFYTAIADNLTSLTFVAAYRRNLTSDNIVLNNDTTEFNSALKLSSDAPGDLAVFRSILSDAIEDGLFIQLKWDSNQVPDAVIDRMSVLWQILRDILIEFEINTIDEVEPFDKGFINPSRVAAYQMSVAEYMTNDSIDNIYSGDLYMQNLRSCMFPSVDGLTTERTFEYNGVDTEYDYLTTGAFRQAFWPEDFSGAYNRMITVSSLLFILRRSLRYGDYYSTGRPNLLAVGQLSIPVSEGQVNPIDVTKNLLMQRYLNASNWVGRRDLATYVSFFGVKPSNLPPHPVFIAHRKTPLSRNITTNTSENQGAQSTNLLGKTDNNAFDVFIDDFGVIIGVTSYDVMPVYTTGIDRNFSNSDRFSLFNPMLQNVGDQEIELAELTGIVNGERQPFAYTVRYAQYKFGISKAHGAFVNSLPGYTVKYPPFVFVADNAANLDEYRINPDFIRDKPFYFDQLFAQRTGLSPANYYHFIVSVQNTHSAARKMQYQPPVLF